VWSGEVGWGGDCVNHRPRLKLTPCHARRFPGAGGNVDCQLPEEMHQGLSADVNLRIQQAQDQSCISPYDTQAPPPFQPYLALQPPCTH